MLDEAKLSVRLGSVQQVYNVCTLRTSTKGAKFDLFLSSHGHAKVANKQTNNVKPVRASCASLQHHEQNTDAPI